MAKFNEYSQKGSTLMQQALKKYAEGNFESGDKDRELANKYFDMMMDEINSEEGKITQMYGESRNFGVIYNIFEQNIDNIYNNESKRYIIKEAYDLIKNNPLLNEQFKIYDMFETAKNVENVKEFVNEATGLIKQFNRKQVINNNQKLIDLIKENKLDEYVEIPEETENLYEAIEYILLNKKTIDNVNEFIKAQNIIAEHIENNKSVVENSNKSFQNFENELEKKEKEINEGMNEDEKRLVDLFTNQKTNKKEIFENYKKETLEKIKCAISTSEENDRDAWNKVYESVNSKQYSESPEQNIINCAEMIEISETIEI